MLGAAGSRGGRSLRRVPRSAAIACPIAIAGAALALSTTSAPATAGQPGPRSTDHDAARSAVVVKAAKDGELGTVVVTTAGFTLYRYTLDRAGKVACTPSNGCTRYWPPLVLAPGMTTPLGAGHLSGLGTVRDPDGRLQVTFKGHPLYRYVGDTGPGGARGEGIDRSWYAVTTSVSRLTSPAPGTTAPAPGTTTPAPGTTAPTTTPTTRPTSTVPTTSATPSTTAPTTTAPSSGGYGY